jgi:hypothetical protein
VLTGGHATGLHGPPSQKGGRMKPVCTRSRQRMLVHGKDCRQQGAAPRKAGGRRGEGRTRRPHDGGGEGGAPVGRKRM